MTSVIHEGLREVTLGGLVSGTGIGFESSSGGTTAAVNMPTCKAGDLILSCFITATGGLTAPGGFTLAGSNVGTSVQTYMHYHVVTDPPGEPATYTYTGLTASQRQICFVDFYRGVDTITPLDQTATVGTNTGTGNSCVISTQTTVTDGCMLVSAIGGNASTGPPTWTQPTSWTQESHSTGLGKGSALADFKQGVRGSTGSETWTWSSTNLEMRGVMIALRPLKGAAIRHMDTAIARSSRW